MVCLRLSGVDDRRGEVPNESGRVSWAGGDIGCALWEGVVLLSPEAVPPDPGQAGTLDDLVERLRLLKAWAGDPSYERIKDRINATWSAAGRPAAELARKNTVADCFRPGRRRVNTDLVIAVVQALHADVGYVAQWRQALRVVGGETQAASQVRVQDSLPQDLAGFTGRASQLDQLRQIHRDGAAVVISAIEGMAGVGKTQLAVHAAHILMRDKAFDRVLFVNLRGFHPDPAQPPADPAAVLDGFLRLLGMAGQQIPHDLPARIAAYRDRLAGTRTLVVLDNAADAAQVRPLLPDAPGCLTLVTSRRSLADLHPATQLTVDVFTAGEAVDFLTRAVPEVAVGTDRHAAARIAQRCGCLPLALGLVAGHIRVMPGWTLTDHADRLDERHDHGRLEGGVGVALDLSYRHLPAGQQRLLRLAALHPGQDFDDYAVAALAGCDLLTVRDGLAQLCRDHLLQQATPDRYGFHDLVRAYATDRAGDQDPPPQRHAALTRLFDFYLATASAAMDVAYPHNRKRRPTVPPAGTPTPDLADQKQADQWLDTELANLLATAHHAAQQGWPEAAWHLSAILDRHLRARGRYPEAETLHRQAQQLAHRLGNRAPEMGALNGLGYVHRMLGRYEQAADHYRQALRIAQDLGDGVGELEAHNGLASVNWMLGRYEQIGDHYRQSLRISQEIGDHVGRRNALTGLGDVHWKLGRYERAADHYGQALRIAQDEGDRGGESAALTGLALVHRLLGQHERAADQYGQALQIAQDLGDRVVELQSLTGLGYVHLVLGRHGEAADCYQQVLDLADELDSSNWKFEALQGLGRLHHTTDRPDLALTHHEQALQLATDLAQPADQARAHDGLAHAHHALDDHDRARDHWQHALDILTALGADHTEETRVNVPSIRAHLTTAARRAQSR